jgi:hypothetical protein
MAGDGGWELLKAQSATVVAAAAAGRGELELARRRWRLAHGRCADALEHLERAVGPLPDGTVLTVAQLLEHPAALRVLQQVGVSGRVSGASAGGTAVPATGATGVAKGFRKSCKYGRRCKNPRNCSFHHPGDPQLSRNFPEKLCELPPLGWETAVSRRSGEIYYVNSASGATQFELPVADVGGAVIALIREEAAHEYLALVQDKQVCRCPFRARVINTFEFCRGPKCLPVIQVEVALRRLHAVRVLRPDDARWCLGRRAVSLLNRLPARDALVVRSLTSARRDVRAQSAPTPQTRTRRLDVCRCSSGWRSWQLSTAPELTSARPAVSSTGRRECCYRGNIREPAYCAMMMSHRCGAVYRDHRAAV